MKKQLPKFITLLLILSLFVVGFLYLLIAQYSPWSRDAFLDGRTSVVKGVDVGGPNPSLK